MAEGCAGCNATAEKVRLYRYGGRWLCKDCIEHLAFEAEICPNCGAGVDDEHTVAIILEHPDNPPGKLQNAQRSFLRICPICHIVFFDRLEYSILEGLSH